VLVDKTKGSNIQNPNIHLNATPWTIKKSRNQPPNSGTYRVYIDTAVHIEKKVDTPRADLVKKKLMLLEMT
jgi:hypothetical protein